MRVLVCPDKFKGSLSAREVCNSISEGLQKRGIHDYELLPLADGGEGTCELLTHHAGGRLVPIRAAGPLFSPITATFGISGDETSGFVEMANASGLALIKPVERNPLYTTTLGTGQIIRRLMEQGVTNITLGLGGSATNDAGIGVATALGFKFLDGAGHVLSPIGKNLVRLHEINADDVLPKLSTTMVTALCDVSNPLFGQDGAACVFGPQKGADRNATKLLDDGLRNFREVVHRCLGKEANFPGAGAAGGLGAGAKVFLNAKIEKGFDFILRATSLDDRMANANLIITGEGMLDTQSLSGKVVMQVTRLAKAKGTPVVVVCGQNQLSDAELKKSGIVQAITLSADGVPPEVAMQRAYPLIVEKIVKELKV